ncbi:MAG: sigma factor-like helix-turn-helix DNA-binding protein [bacterium]|nr:sigma factor-like helix-turn-helix DNA-binding protein [bacterium]
MEPRKPQELNSQNKTVSSLLPSEFAERAFLALLSRSKEVVLKRFSLNGEKESTLDKIGQQFKITRERVRQIEKGAMAKINSASAKEVSEFNSLFQNIIGKYGGVMERNFFLDRTIAFMEEERGAKVKDAEEEKRGLILIVALINEIKHDLADKKHKDIFYLNKESLEAASLAVGEAIKIFTQEKKAMGLSDIFNLVKGRPALKEKNINLIEDAFLSYFMLSAEIESNARGQWGLKTWPFIFPRSVRDKAYLILFYKKEPFHFKTIAGLINETWTKKKKPALAETVHNELIKDKRFVLVGRGIYALAEWGYEKGTVQDIIKRVLVKKGQPMKKEEIIKEVSAQRLVKPSTIILNLKNKDIFVAIAEGTYTLK